MYYQTFSDVAAQVSGELTLEDVLMQIGYNLDAFRLPAPTRPRRLPEPAYRMRWLQESTTSRTINPHCKDTSARAGSPLAVVVSI